MGLFYQKGGFHAGIMLENKSLYGYKTHIYFARTAMVFRMRIVTPIACAKECR
jgi:hypothetical protein